MLNLKVTAARKKNLQLIRYAALALLVVWLVAPRPGATQELAQAKVQPGVAAEDAQLKSGRFDVRWGDPPPNSDEPTKITYLLTDDKGDTVELQADDETPFKEHGGPLALIGKKVRVRFHQKEAMEQNTPDRIVLKIAAIEIEPEQPDKEREKPDEFNNKQDLAITGVQSLTGSQKWVTILCRFADSTSITPHEKPWFENLMGGTYPGMDYFWKEVSYSNINLTGSVVVGWYNLPNPRSYYLTSSGVNLDLLALHVTEIADRDVYFPAYSGINLMFNDYIGNGAWGTSGKTLMWDGVTKSYGMTWIPPWGYADSNILAQEMGHAFGLMHSSGPYNSIYDSKWDPMSSGGRCYPRHATYGCLPDHTIAFHKDRLGWIPASRKYVVSPGSTANVTLERLAQPAILDADRYWMAQIPINGSTTQFYTVESRFFAGYDDQVPGQAVVIHKVNTTLADRLAQVVDADLNGNPNDSGAMWVVGEKFLDPENNISVEVLWSSLSSFTVTIKNASCSSPVTRIGFGTVSRTLSTSDCRSLVRTSSHYADRYDFIGTAGQQVSVSLYSSSFDTYLSLIGPTGALIEDDDGGGNTNSRIPAGSGYYTLPSSGRYFIEVSSYYVNATGSYTLSLLPPGCYYSISPSSKSFSGTGGTGTVAVTTSAGCNWTASASASWVVLGSGGGQGNGTLSYTVRPYYSTSSSTRTATISVAGRTHTVSQSSCNSIQCFP